MAVQWQMKMIIRPRIIQPIPYPSQLTKGLVGYWPLDEGGGTTAFDRSGNNNNGTLINNPSWVTSPYGRGLQFIDGTSDYISTTFYPAFSTGFTIIIDVTPASLTSILYFCDNSNGSVGVGIRTGSTPSQLQWFTYPGPCLSTTGSILANGIRSHIALVHGPDKNLTYHNGQLVFSQLSDFNLALGPSESPLSFMADYEGNNSLTGVLNDIKVYDRPLSLSEIQQLYLHGLQASRDPIELWAAATAGGGAGTSYEDDVNVQVSVQSSATDAAASNDEVNATCTESCEVSDNISLTDDVSSAASCGGSVVDTISFVDSVTASIIESCSVADAISFIDDVSGSTTISVSVTDTGAFTDDTNSTVSISSSVDDTYTPNGATAYFDEVNVALTCGASVVDTLTATDNVSVTATIASEATDAYGLFDDVSCSTIASCEVTDALAYSDEVTATVTVSDSAIDGVSFGDAVNAQCNVQCEIDDSYTPISGFLVSAAFLMLKKHR